MSTLDKIGKALPPWPTTGKVAAVSLGALAVALSILCSPAASRFWASLVDRRDGIAGSLLSVNASLLGFSITSFAVLLSVRKEDKFAQLEKIEGASRQLWTALISASWATGLGALTALLVLVIKSPVLEPWFQNALAATLFVVTSYVALTFVGVIAVIHTLVIILRPEVVKEKAVITKPEAENAGFELGGPADDE
jgi:hypothetical protein